MGFRLKSMKSSVGYASVEQEDIEMAIAPVVEAEEEDPYYVEVRFITAQLFETAHGTATAREGGRIIKLLSRQAKAVVFDEPVKVRSDSVQLTVSWDKATMVASVHLQGEASNVWVDGLDASTAAVVGRVCVSWHRVEPVEEDDALRCADNLFQQFRNDTGTLGRAEVRALVRCALDVGGNVTTLGGIERNGCLAMCVVIPDEDLFAYVLHRHCIFRVCYGASGLAEKANWKSMLALVFVSLLWSFSANCLVSAIVIPNADRIYQVIVITLVDTFGVGVLTVLFYLAHSDCVESACDICYRNSIPAFITTIFSFATLVLILSSLTPDELYLAVYSFFPIWSTARVTEVFKLGTYWAMQVQLGSYPTTTPTPTRTPSRNNSSHRHHLSTPDSSPLVTPHGGAAKP